MTESSLRAVPTQYYEGAVALGGTHERAIFTVVLPAAKSGVVAALCLESGVRSEKRWLLSWWLVISENAGRNLQRSQNTDSNIVIEMGYASGLHREALIATGVVLFVFILLLNFCVALLKRGKNYE